MLAAIIIIALLPAIACIAAAARSRLDLSPAGRLRMTRKYLKECRKSRLISCANSRRPASRRPDLPTINQKQLYGNTN